MEKYISNPIQEIKNSIDIENIISFYTGNEFKRGFMLCPFHNEKTPSFSINKAKQIYKCFSCGKYSDSVGFVAEYLKINQRQAAIQIDKDFNLGVFEKNETTNDSIRRVKRLQKEKMQIDKWLKESYLVLANFVCDYRNKKRDFQTETDFLLAGYLSDVLINGTIEEKMEVGEKYDKFIQRLGKYRCN